MLVACLQQAPPTVASTAECAELLKAALEATRRRLKGRPAKNPAQRFSRARLNALIDEAIVDAHGDDEQLVGFLSRIEDELEVPFSTKILGVQAEVVRIESLGPWRLEAFDAAAGAKAFDQKKRKRTGNHEEEM
ncbi:MAG: hypothetical protein IT452_20255 [Planctomycetia bacterium]|nr:hypothetical protein [Planctomycetia bacterium]